MVDAYPSATRHAPKTERGRRLASKDPEDHPGAEPRTCSLIRDHGPHPWGPVDLVTDSLANWCDGKPT